jgi:hypothetical protein
LSIKEERLAILESGVKRIYPDWGANYTKESLVNLYKWFEKQVAYRIMTEEEKKEVEKQISKTPLFVGVIPIPQFSFTNETVSICFDTGLYLGETLIHNLSRIKWLQKLTSTNFIYYAQPLLGHSQSKVPVSPRASIEGIARRILDKDAAEITFIALYEKWFENFMRR